MYRDIMLYLYYKQLVIIIIIFSSDTMLAYDVYLYILLHISKILFSNWQYFKHEQPYICN